MNTGHVLSNSHPLLLSSAFLLISLLSSLTTPLLSHSNVAVHPFSWIRTFHRCYRAEQLCLLIHACTTPNTASCERTARHEPLTLRNQKHKFLLLLLPLFLPCSFQVKTKQQKAAGSCERAPKSAVRH